MSGTSSKKRSDRYGIAGQGLRFMIEFGVILFCYRFFLCVCYFFIFIFCFNKLECLKKKLECQLTAMFLCEFVAVGMIQSVF